MILATQTLSQQKYAKNNNFKKKVFSERPTEYEHFMKLQSEMVGGGYCAAWYMRRFSTPVSVSSEPLPHAAMGLDCYVQWTSPIRRYSDLQVNFDAYKKANSTSTQL